MNYELCIMKTSISQTISILRFPLCVVIVLIHSNIALYNASVNQFTSTHILFNYIIGDICFVSLALFFFISGFLLFREGNFNLVIFKNKIIHRVYSLLIPYILWNLICFIIIFILQQIKPNINLLLHKQIADFRIQDFILIFWNLREVTGYQTDQAGPLVGQFWFIQCLLVYTFMAPIIWYATKKLRMIFVITLGIIALSGMIPEVPGFNAYYLYIFILGAYFSINHSSWVLSPKSLIGFMVAYGVLFSMRIMYQSDIKLIEETLFIFIILNVVHLLTKNKQLGSIAQYLSVTSFFVFAIHRYFTSIGLNLCSKIDFQNGYMPIICFLAISFCSVICSVLAYALMDRFCHKALLGNVKKITSAISILRSLVDVITKCLNNEDCKSVVFYAHIFIYFNYSTY